MKRILLILAFLLLPLNSWATFTLHDHQENGGGGLATTVTLSAAVTTGDLIVAGCGGASAQSITQIDDGAGHNLTLLTENTSGNDRLGMGYSLSAQVTGTQTFTCTYATTGNVQREFHVWTFTPSAAVDPIDASLTTGNNVSSTAISTGSISTNGTDEVTVTMAYYDAAQVATALQTMTVNAISSLNPGGNAASWYNTFASTQTGSGTATITATRWLANIAAFKIPGGGGGGPDVTKFRRRVQ